MDSDTQRRLRTFEKTVQEFVRLFKRRWIGELEDLVDLVREVCSGFAISKAQEHNHAPPSVSNALSERAEASEHPDSLASPFEFGSGDFKICKHRIQDAIVERNDRSMERLFEPDSEGAGDEWCVFRVDILDIAARDDLLSEELLPFVALIEELVELHISKYNDTDAKWTVLAWNLHTRHGLPYAEVVAILAQDGVRVTPTVLRKRVSRFVSWLDPFKTDIQKLMRSEEQQFWMDGLDRLRRKYGL